MQSLTKPPDDVHARRSRRKEARPGELIAAALDLFVEKGFAARAGVSKGTLFLYFPSKEELFKAVVRENISNRYPEWSAQLDAFEGDTPALLKHGMTMWWAHIGGTKASGITKLIISEARNFPDLAAFYHHEVIIPGHDLIQRILQRGIDRGEIRNINVEYGVYSVLAPMIFLTLWKHSMGACPEHSFELVPEQYIESQLDTILNGLSCKPRGTTASPPGTGTGQDTT
jgi:TetR/AcrR family transcriptional regulator